MVIELIKFQSKKHFCLCQCWKTGFLIRRSGSTSVSPSLDIYSVSTAMINPNKLSIPIWIEDTEERSVETLRLIDSGAGGKFIDQKYAKRMGFKTHKFEKPLQAYNVDGTKNKQGTIKYYVNLNLEINGRKTMLQFSLFRLFLLSFGLLSFPISYLFSELGLFLLSFVDNTIMLIRLWYIK